MAPSWTSALVACLSVLAAPASSFLQAQQPLSGPCAWAVGEACGDALKEPSEEEALFQRVWLLQYRFHALDISPAARAKSGGASDGATEYVQALLDQRVAAEVLRVAAQAKLLGSDGNETNTAAALAGVEENMAGDLVALLQTAALDVSIILICFLATSILKGYFPLVFTARDPEGKCAGLCGWVVASWRLSFDDVLLEAGLDHALLLEYTRLAMTIMMAIGIPFLGILSPVYMFLGGNAAGEDHLSWIGLNNVKPHNDVVYWLVSVAVWYVVLVMQYLIYRWHTNVFLPRRFEWLKDMDRLKATTVVVQNIPEGQNTTQGVTDYFNDFVFGRDVVKEVFIVKDASDLTPLVQEKETLEKAQKQKKLDKQQDEQLARLTEVKQEIAKKAAQVQTDDVLNCSRAFVTFYHRREATISLKLLSPDDEEEIEVVPVPDPRDIIWENLIEDPNRSLAESLVGLGLIFALVWGLMPMVLGISVVTDLDNLEKWFPSLSGFVEKYPVGATIFDTVSSSLALSIIMGFLPTFLLCIFDYSFNLQSRNSSQVYMQRYYFDFQVVFVLLVPAIGDSVLTTFTELASAPFSVFTLLATTMPSSSHYFMSYFVVQWTTHGMSVTRYVTLIKYMLLARIYGRDDAKEMSEPEDQDYYGLGSRSARWSFLCTTGLVYCTISPIMTVFAFVHFAFCRLVYGYLFVYAETKKPGLGGAFWVIMLRQTQQGLFIFVILMIGVLLQRAESPLPGVFAACSFLPLTYTYRMYLQVRWEVLEFVDVKEYDEKLEMGQVREFLHEDVRNYRQPELQTKEAEQEPEKVEEPKPTFWSPQGLFSGQPRSLCKPC